MMPSECASATASQAWSRRFDRLGDRESRAELDEGTQVVAAEVLHDDERHAVLLLDAEHARDVLVLKARGGARLALEPGDALGPIGEGREKDLDGDGAIEVAIVGGEDVTHAAFAEGGAEPVLAEEDVADGEGCHGGRDGWLAAGGRWGGGARS